MAMPKHEEHLFTKYAFKRLQDIAESCQRRVQAELEKEASWGRIAKYALGALGIGGTGYVGAKAYGQYKKNEDRFKMEDTSSWEKPEDFWTNKPAASAASAGYAAPTDVPTTRPSKGRVIYVPDGMTPPSGATLVSESNAYGVKRRWYRLPEGMEEAKGRVIRVPAGMTPPSGATLISEGSPYGVKRRWYRLPENMEKEAGIGTIVRGVGADLLSGLAGDWALGGLLKGTGRMLGAESKTALRKGLDNSNLITQGSKVNGKALNSLEDLGNYRSTANEALKEQAAKAGRIFDETGEAWNKTRRYFSPEETANLGQRFFERTGQHLAHWGQKLTDMADSGQAAYRRSLNHHFGNRTIGNQIARKLVGATSLGIPIGYTVAAEMQEPGTWWAEPGKWYGKAFEYASLPGLATKAVQGVGSMVENAARNATIEGARMGSQITAGELANVGRRAYLAGLIDPDKLSYMVADRANKTINAHLAAQTEAMDRLKG